MTEKHKLFLATAAGMVLATVVILPLARPPAPNLVRNGGFDEGLKSWGWYVHRSQGARAEFVAEDLRSANGHVARISVTQPALHDSVEFAQGPVSVQAGHEYRLSFRARSTARQPIRVQIIRNAPPWTFYGFRVSTEITPQWKIYRLTGRAMLTGDDGKLVFQCGGAAGEIWLDNIDLHDGGT